MEHYNSDFIIRNHELINIIFNVGDTQRQFNFPDNPKLRDVNLEGIETYSVKTLPVNSNGVPTVLDQYLQTTFITLENYAGRQFVKDMPLVDFISNSFGTGVDTKENWNKKFAGQRVNYPKSYITFNDLAVVPVANFVWQFSIFYKDTPSIQNSNNKASFQNRS